MGTSIRKSGSDFSYMYFMKLWVFSLIQIVHQVFRYPVAFSFGIVTCFITSTSTLAIQALTFAEYFRQGIGLKVADAQMAKLTNIGISFSAIGKICDNAEF